MLNCLFLSYDSPHGPSAEAGWKTGEGCEKSYNTEQIDIIFLGFVCPALQTKGGYASQSFKIKHLIETMRSVSICVLKKWYTDSPASELLFWGFASSNGPVINVFQTSWRTLRYTPHYLYSIQQPHISLAWFVELLWSHTVQRSAPGPRPLKTWRLVWTRLWYLSVVLPWVADTPVNRNLMIILTAKSCSLVWLFSRCCRTWWADLTRSDAELYYWSCGTGACGTERQL